MGKTECILFGTKSKLRKAEEFKKLHICQNKTVQFTKSLGPRSHIGFSELDSLGMLNVDFRV